ncbi:DUF2092 domain-containing protein [Pantanalinema rosaneae CENA516]|uniref:DUF2092 domain-containing protein n=1 Tax=Pantanalinema rosaneae TaxID=1620701 RepID=UPI003D6EA228
MNNNHFLNQIGGGVLALGMTLGLGAIAPMPAQSQTLDPDATEVLKSMSDYLAKTSAFSVNADVDSEVIARTGQKLQFSSYASLVMQRSKGLYFQRRGALADVELFFDGSQVALFGRRINSYARIPLKGTIDNAIRTVEAQTGLPLPGADLLFANPYAVLSEGVESSTYMGTAYIDGVEVHHLAFREAEVDWQIWVQTGDRPLPMKYVITTKWLTGAPQYEIRLRDWNTEPQIGANRFTFTVPAGALQLDALPASQIEDFQKAQ